MLDRKVRTPFNFFIRFLGMSIIVGFLFYLVLELLQLDQLLSKVLPISNYYLKFTINLILGIAIGVLLLRFSVKQTFIYNALRGTDVKRVLIYYTFVLVILLTASIVSTVTPINLELYKFSAEFLKISVSALIIIEIGGQAISYIISIYFLGKFLKQGAENGKFVNENIHNEQAL